MDKYKRKNVKIKSIKNRGKRKKSIGKIEGKKKDNKKSAFYDKIYTKKTRKKVAPKNVCVIEFQKANAVKNKYFRQ